MSRLAGARAARSRVAAAAQTHRRQMRALQRQHGSWSRRHDLRMTAAMASASSSPVKAPRGGSGSGEDEENFQGNAPAGAEALAARVAAVEAAQAAHAQESKVREVRGAIKTPPEMPGSGELHQAYRASQGLVAQPMRIEQGL